MSLIKSVVVKNIDGLQVRIKTEVNPRFRLAVLPSEKAPKVALKKQKRPVLLHTGYERNTKKRTALVRLKR